MNDVMERGKQWAADCGIEYRESDGENGARWKYLRDPAPCTVCEQTIPAGRLVWTTLGTSLATHIACQSVPRALMGMLDTGKLDRALRGTKHETTPKAAAKYLGKLDPRTCPRFTLTPTTAVTSKPEMRDLVAAGKGFAMRRDAFVAEGQPQAASAPKVKSAPKREPVVKVDPTPAPAVAEPVHVVDVPGELPGCVAAWLERLVYGPKKDYARAWAEHTFCGAPEPVDPGAEWAAKARRRMEYVLAG